MQKEYSKFYENAKRIGRIALASILLVEPLIDTSYAKDKKTKDLKNEMSNSIKVERMVDKMAQKVVAVKEEVAKDVQKMINAINTDTKVKIYKEIIEKRDKKEYKEAYKDYWKTLHGDEKKIFEQNWKEAESIVTNESTKTLIDYLQKKFPNVKNVIVQLSGSGSEATRYTQYDAVIKIEMINGNSIWYGLRGSKSNEYGYSYEIIGERKISEKETKEYELVLKDLIAQLSKWEGAKGRFANLRYMLTEPNSVTYLFISAETGVGSFVNVKREGDGSTTINVNGSPSTFNALLEKIQKESFYEYSPLWYAIKKIGVINNANSIFGPMLLSNGEYKIKIGEKGKVKTEIYRGGLIKIDGEYIAVSAPIIEKLPEMDKPKVYVVVYKLDSNQNYISSEKIEIATEKQITIGKNDINIEVTPSKESITPIISQLENQTYVLELDGIKIPLIPSLNNSYKIHTPQGDYEIYLKSIKPIEPLVRPDLNLQGEINIINLNTKESQRIIIDIGKQQRIKVGDREFNVNIEAPSNIVLTNSMEYIKTRINLNTTKLETNKGEKYYLNTISGNWTGNAFGNEIQGGIKILTLSNGPFGEEERKLEKKIPRTLKEEELRKEKLAQYGAIGTMLGIGIENLIGMSFNVNNAAGKGVWGTIYDPTALIEKDITASGDALKQLTILTDKIIGWNSLAVTGMTAYEQNSLKKGETGIDSIKDVVGLGLWFKLDEGPLHGAGKVTNEKIKEEIYRNVIIDAKGTKTEGVFEAFDPNREGLQILSLRYSKEKKAGEKEGNSVTIERSDYWSGIGYRKNIENGVFNSIYGKLNINELRNINNEIMKGESLTIEKSIKSAFNKWNPVVGIGTNIGAFEVGGRWAKTNEIEKTKSFGLITDIRDISEKGITLVTKGMKLFGDLEIDATYDESRREYLMKSNDIINGSGIGKNEMIEIQPLWKAKDGSFWYLNIRTKLDKATMNSLTITEERKYRELEIRPGYKNKWMELNAFYITNDNETASKTITSQQKIIGKRKQLGINLFGKIGKDVDANLSYNRTTDSINGSWWMINSSIRIKLGSTEEKKEKKK